LNVTGAAGSKDCGKYWRGEALDNAKADAALVTLQITGQKPVVTKAPEHCSFQAARSCDRRVTLRGERMWSFRPFGECPAPKCVIFGISADAFDGGVHLGLRGFFFPEIDYDKIDKLRPGSDDCYQRTDG
jgi:ribosomal protein L5